SRSTRNAGGAWFGGEPLRAARGICRASAANGGAHPAEARRRRWPARRSHQVGSGAQSARFRCGKDSALRTRGLRIRIHVAIPADRLEKLLEARRTLRTTALRISALGVCVEKRGNWRTSYGHHRVLQPGRLAIGTLGWPLYRAEHDRIATNA